MDCPGRSVPDAAETAPVRDPLLHPRSRRSSDRSGADHGPEGGLDASRLVVGYVRRGVLTIAVTGTLWSIFSTGRTNMCREQAAPSRTPRRCGASRTPGPA